MELFHLPLREIEEKFTKSEIILLGWRSQEQSHNFKKKMDNKDESPKHSTDTKRKSYHDGIGPERMPDEFFASKDLYDGSGRLIANKGDFNLGQVRGEQARGYFERVLRIPMPPNMITKIRNEDSASDEIRKAYNIRG